MTKSLEHVPLVPSLTLHCWACGYKLLKKRCILLEVDGWGRELHRKCAEKLLINKENTNERR